MEYRDLPHAQRGITKFIEQTYNRERMRSEPGYRPPAQFDKLDRTAVA